MGWLKLGARTSATPSISFAEDLKSTTQHIETVSIGPNPLSEYPTHHPLVHSSTPDHKLPFIPLEEVKKRTSEASGGLCMCAPFIFSITR
jgi:hypothetical protein